MEKKEAHNIISTTTKPVDSMCERLFNALNTNNTFRPLRRLTNWQQNSEPQSGPQPNIIPVTDATDAKRKTPSPPPQGKSKVALPTSFAKDGVNGTDKMGAPVATKKDVKGTQNGATIPQPAPPKVVIVPLPAPVTGPASTDTTDTKPKKSLNEKVEDYIHRTKQKLRSNTTLGRTQTTK